MNDEFQLAKTYEAADIEKQIYQQWLAGGAFHAEPDERVDKYVIMMPLPNVTGALHMGHAMDNVMQDMLIRWHRMLGHNTLWMPGTDHAGIATQAVVEKRMKELEGLTRHDVGREGLTRHDVGREGLIRKIWNWKDMHQTRIIEQQQRMGCSCDWTRQRFTMDKVCSRAVRHTFFKMFCDELIFRGKRLVNWDPFLLTSISDDEIYHETVQGHFWHIRYPVIDPQPGEPGEVIVATTRPETMLGDTAVAVHPDPQAALEAEIAKVKQELENAPAKEKPQRRQELSDLENRKTELLPLLLKLRDMAREGRQIRLPLLKRPIPLVLDEWAKPGLGSGCVKITPAHDYNDYGVWQRHKEHMTLINILNPNGSLNENAGPYAGLDRFEARKKVVTDLELENLLDKVEDRQIEIGHSDRSKTPIEPYLSDQWFIFMGDRSQGVVMGRGSKKEFHCSGLVQAAMDAVKQGRVRFHPERYIKTYLDWLEEKRDWPISRQLWWGHRIPVWSLTVPFRSCPDILQKLFQKDRLPVDWQEQIAVRLFNKEQGESVLVKNNADAGRLAADPEDTILIDICLLRDKEETIALLNSLGFKQEEDVLDTWFSSAIWPHSTLGWPDPETVETDKGVSLAGKKGYQNCLDYYYPGSCLVTGRDIITLWVARMIIAGLYNLGDIPFKDVFIHANILDGKGERMSKSKGNGIDPVDIIDAYGTDAMRYILCDMQTGNQDIRLPVTAVCPLCGQHNDLALSKRGRSIFTYQCVSCKKEFDVLGTMPDIPAAKLISERFLEGKKFCTKLWNTARFALGNLAEVPHQPMTFDQLQLEDRWILAALNQTIRQATRSLEEYNPANALGTVRDFMWGKLCDWYLELIKPRLAQDNESARTARRVLAYSLDRTLRLLHPFVPFLTEYLYQLLRTQVPDPSLNGLTPADKHSALLLTADWPKAIENLDHAELLATFSALQDAAGGIREIRSTAQISPKQPLKVTIKPPVSQADRIRNQSHVIRYMANVHEIVIDPQARRPQGSVSKLVGEVQIFVHDLVDNEKEKTRLLKELDKVEKELALIDKKLGNADFVDRARAEVVEKQRQQKSIFESQKTAITQSLADLQV